jgi:hypothetical protein
VSSVSTEPCRLRDRPHGAPRVILPPQHARINGGVPDDVVVIHLQVVVAAHVPVTFRPPLGIREHYNSVLHCILGGNETHTADPPFATQHMSTARLVS